MSAAQIRRFVASVNRDRKCRCGAMFTPPVAFPKRARCDACIAAAARRAQARTEAAVNAEAERKAEWARMHCDDCRAKLLVPAALCGMCDPYWIEPEAEVFDR